MMNEPRNTQSGSADPDWEALARYQAGECSPAEAAAITAWLEAHPADARLLGALDSAVQRLAHRPSAEDIDVESALHRMRGQSRAVSAPIPFPQIRPARQPAAWWRGPGLAAAAGVAAIAGSALLWRVQRTESPVAIAASERTYATVVGQQDTIRLSDGSTVILGPASELKVASGYGDNARTVGLRGEAYFDVTHDDARPFSVETPAAVIRDLGTVFTVRADAADRVVVAVSAGSVQLWSRADSAAANVVLQAGDRGVFAAASGISAERAVQTADDFAWTKGRLVLRDASLAETSSALERWYGVTLESGDPSLDGRHITASFDRENVEQVLEIISVALGATVERRGSTAILRPIRGEPMVR